MHITDLRGRPLTVSRTLIILLAAGFLLRLGFFFAVKPWQPNYIYDKIIMIDAGPYHEFAAHILQDRSFANVGTYRSPGYPLFLLAFYALFGVKPWIVILAQVFLGTFTVFLTWLWTRQWFSEPTGLAVAAFAAVEPHLIIYGACLLTETLFVAVLLASVLLWLRALSRNSAFLFALAGLLTGYATLIRPIAMLFPVTLIGLTFIYRWRPLSYGLRAAGIIAVTFFLAIFPWGMRNYLHYGHFSLTDVNGFNMLFVNAAYTETARTGKTFVQVQDEFLAVAAQRGVTDKTNPFVRSDVYRQIATGYLKEHRLLFLHRYAVGMGTLFLNLASTDTADLLGLKRIQYQYNIYEFNKFSNMILWYFGNKTGHEMLIGMGIAFFLLCSYLFCLTGRYGAVRRKEYLPLIFNLGIMAYFIAVTGLFGMARYRLPLIPFYLPYTAMGFLQLKEYLDRRAAMKAVPAATVEGKGQQ